MYNFSQLKLKMYIEEEQLYVHSIYTNVDIYDNIIYNNL